MAKRCSCVSFSPCFADRAKFAAKVVLDCLAGAVALVVLTAVAWAVLCLRSGRALVPILVLALLSACEPEGLHRGRDAGADVRLDAGAAICGPLEGYRVSDCPERVEIGGVSRPCQRTFKATDAGEAPIPSACVFVAADGSFKNYLVPSCDLCAGVSL